jgi:hypothetical protein
VVGSARETSGWCRLIFSLSNSVFFSLLFFEKRRQEEKKFVWLIMMNCIFGCVIRVMKGIFFDCWGLERLNGVLSSFIYATTILLLRGRIASAFDRSPFACTRILI